MSAGYWLGAIGAIARELCRDLIRYRDRTGPLFIKEFLRSGYAFAQRSKLRRIHFLDLCPPAADMDVQLGSVRFTRSNANPYEVFCVCSLAAMRQPERIFEFGTFDGATTSRLAQAAPRSEVLTLDLPPERMRHASELMDESEFADMGEVGRRFRGRPEAGRIRQLFGDSRTFDYRPFERSCDLVFVDACHEYEFVRSDSNAALRLVREGGLVVWHDYTPGWPGVVRAIDELPIRDHIVHIDGTSLAVYVGSNIR